MSCQLGNFFLPNILICEVVIALHADYNCYRVPMAYLDQACIHISAHPVFSVSTLLKTFFLNKMNLTLAKLSDFYPKCYFTNLIIEVFLVRYSRDLTIAGSQYFGLNIPVHVSNKPHT